VTELLEKARGIVSTDEAIHYQIEYTRKIINHEAQVTENEVIVARKSKIICITFEQLQHNREISWHGHLMDFLIRYFLDTN
jgi:hypothetical protein